MVPARIIQYSNDSVDTVESLERLTVKQVSPFIPTPVPEFGASSVPLMRYVDEFISANGACIIFVFLIYHSSRAWYQHSTTPVMATQSTFFKNGSFFGWKTIKELWQKGIKRSAKGQTMVVPRLKASYIFRDSWTRLNVTRAKVMQVCPHMYPR